MSEASREFFEQAENRPEPVAEIQANVISHAMGDMSPAQISAATQPDVEPSALEGAKILGGQLWDAMTPAFSLGSDEVARALFNGNPFTFNGDTFPEHHPEPSHGLTIEPLHNEREMEGMER